MIEKILKENSEIIFNVVINNIDDVVAIFDVDLNYLTVNTATCKLLNKQKHELEGKNLLELFPNLTASNSHRELLHAFSGEKVVDVLSEGTFTRAGAKYLTSYYPLKKDGTVYAVLAITKKLYFPEA